MWDTASATYSDEGYRDIADRVIQILDEKRILSKGSTVMDIGCGPGTYAFRMSPLVNRIVCIDSSRPMLERLQSEAARKGIDNIDTVLCDCKEISRDLVCDVAFSSLCPPVNCPEMILSMEDHASEWCVYVSSAKTGHSIETEIWEGLGRSYSYDGYLTSFPDSFLRSIGRQTSLFFLEQRNSETVSADQCYDRYRQKVSKFRDITETEESTIWTVVDRHTIDGMVTIESNNRMGLLIWKPLHVSHPDLLN